MFDLSRYLKPTNLFWRVVGSQMLCMLQRPVWICSSWEVGVVVVWGRSRLSQQQEAILISKATMKSALRAQLRPSNLQWICVTPVPEFLVNLHPFGPRILSEFTSLRHPKSTRNPCENHTKFTRNSHTIAKEIHIPNFVRYVLFLLIFKHQAKFTWKWGVNSP